MPLTDTRDLQHLALLRQSLAILKEDLAFELTKLDATPEAQAVALTRTGMNTIRASIIEAEATIRGTALEHYDGTGEREAWPGVTVKLFNVVDYDPVEAREWARENAPTLLTLSKSAFEKAALAYLADAVATVRKEPRAQIARDLSEYLPENALLEDVGDEREDIPI